MTGPDFTKRGAAGPQQQFDPVTGAPLPPGPAAYSAVDPAQTSVWPGYPAGGQPAYDGPPAVPANGYPQPGYPQPGYPHTGYPQPGYPAPGPPPGYQPAGFPGYPPVGYQLVPMYAMPRRPAKPGAATAAAVLAYIQSGFVLIGSITMFSGSAGLDDFSRSGDLSSELTVIGIITVLAGALLIAGATSLLNRKRPLLLIGNVLSIGISLYFVVRLMDFFFGVAVWVPILFAVLPIISVALASSSDVRSWARTGAISEE